MSLLTGRKSMSLLARRNSGYEFLDGPAPVPTDLYTSAAFLRSDFDANEWEVQTYQGKPLTLDWAVELWDGSLLTDDQNTVLRRSLKHLLIIGTKGVNGEFATLATASQNLRFVHTAKLIDYLLINARTYQLLEFGLGALDGDHLKAILTHLCTSPWAEQSVYAWHDRVSTFCKLQLPALSMAEEQKIFEEHPGMLETSDDQLEGYKLDIAVEDLPRVRAALMKAKLYYGNRCNGYKISSTKLSALIYKDTLRGCQSSKSSIEALNFYPSEQNYKRECKGVRVTTGEAAFLKNSVYSNYRYVLINSIILNTLDLPAPAGTETIYNYRPEVSQSARFRSVPSENLLRLFRNSTEFHIVHGRKILDGFIKVATYCHANNVTMVRISDSDLQKIVGPELVDFGVKKLGLSAFSTTKSKRKGSRKAFYQNLRANHGLLELVLVYIGCVEFNLGTLTARRIDELVKLQAATCLDSSKSWVNFSLAKSTRHAFGMRQSQSRPVDALAVEMIEELRRFQESLVRLGVISELTDLFASPASLGHKGLRDCSTHLYNRNLDYFCDYFESDYNADGERYYVRQHQLRRFFAIMFFYTHGYGQLDTLRWMLGHRDIEHVWNYLTECVEPHIIRGVNSKYFANLAKQDRLDNYEALRNLLSEEFGTTNFKLIDSQKITDYLDALQVEGKAVVTTEFFTDEDGKSMEILFIVAGAKNEQPDEA